MIKEEQEYSWEQVEQFLALQIIISLFDSNALSQNWLTWLRELIAQRCGSDAQRESYYYEQVQHLAQLLNDQRFFTRKRYRIAEVFKRLKQRRNANEVQQIKPLFPSSPPEELSLIYKMIHFLKYIEEEQEELVLLLLRELSAEERVCCNYLLTQIWPLDVSYTTDYSQSLNNVGKLKQAMDVIKNFKRAYQDETSPDFAPLFLEGIRILTFQFGQLSGTERFEMCFRVKPPSDNLVYASKLISAGKHEQLLQFVNYIRKSPNSAQFMTILAILYLWDYQYSENQKPQQGIRIYKLINDYLSDPSSQPRKFYFYDYLKGLVERYEMFFEASLLSFQNEVKKHKYSLKLLFEAGKTCYMLGNYRLALYYHQKVRQRCQEHIGVDLLLVLDYIGLNQQAKARQILSKIEHERSMFNSKEIVRLMVIYSLLGQPEEVLNCSYNEQQSGKEYFAIHGRIIKLINYERTNQMEKALALYHEIVQSKTTIPNLFYPSLFENFQHFYFLLEFGFKYSRIQHGKRCVLSAISVIKKVRKYNPAGSDELKMQLKQRRSFKIERMAI